MEQASISRHSTPIKALAALSMALAAVVAIVGVKFQIDSAAAQQRAQSARDCYRGFLGISMNKSELATFDHCVAHPFEKRIAYDHYVEYLLYTAEQTISLGPEWAERLPRLWRRIANTFAPTLRRGSASGSSPPVQ
ncbi:hypothetical protein J4729_13240 [Leisingera sp. HS039]|uniref:hypothetical protein n=1 Tax=unclassified Leisingera TaxID=2614906 RepID=UPI0010710AAF|nr:MULTISPECIES: hypothetical protein [unclassified Leisingera]MBQ4825507.1 hypothetical protein [Leisingera sp. HS039]QBR37647.1 hypothetical protein ETW23_17525 [Leisingera sp. NJS201]